MTREITRWHLEMTSPQDLRPAAAFAEELRVERALVPCPELNRFFYTAVGGDWFWIDRLVWTWDEWRAYLGRPELETWVGWTAGNPAGYFELEHQPGWEIEIQCFGLLPQFIGRGFGGALLTAAVERAWRAGASRILLNTCSLDAPAALPAYQARGFRIYKEETVVRDFPADAPGPWPGAGPRGR